jgi:hypothetical protein
MKIYQSVVVKIIFTILQLYVGCMFFGVVPGMSGTQFLFSKILGCVMVLCGLQSGFEVVRKLQGK